MVVPLNVLLRAPEVAFQLSDSEARALITWEGVLSEAAKGAEAAGVDAIYAVGHGVAAGALPFETLSSPSCRCSTCSACPASWTAASGSAARCR